MIWVIYEILEAIGTSKGPAFLILRSVLGWSQPDSDRIWPNFLGPQAMEWSTPSVFLIQSCEQKRWALFSATSECWNNASELELYMVLSSPKKMQIKSKGVADGMTVCGKYLCTTLQLDLPSGNLA